MNILYVLGNGLDISLGLPTSYQDFYNYYLQLPSSSPLIDNLKKDMEVERYETWADMEKGLGKYTVNLNNEIELEEVYHNLSDSLNTYLRQIDDNFSIEKKQAELFLNHFIYPWNRFDPAVRRSVQNYINSKNPPFYYDAISFNYTFTLEKIVRSIQNLNYPVSLSQNHLLRSIKHIHQDLNSLEIIMGVNDETQIKNEKLRNTNCQEILVKPYINKQLRNLIDEECIELIKHADLICLFGTSLGETDGIWWNEIGKRLTKGIKVLYFAFDNDEVLHNNKLIQKRRIYEDLLLDRCNIVDNNTMNEIRNNIYVGYKKSIFR